MIVLSPVAEQTSDSNRLAKPVSDLRGKVLGILDDGFGGTVHDTLKAFEQLAHKRFPGVTSRFWVKPQICEPSPGPLVDEIARTVDAAIVGVCA